jgi:hypothetical protein
MLKKVFFGLTFALFLISCNSNQDINRFKDQNKSISTDSVKTKSATALTIDTILLNKYIEAFKNDTISSEKIFFSKLLNIIKDFSGRKLDTTLLTIGNIDGDDVRDTIFSRVYYDSDSIFVDSKWMKNNNINWDYRYANPYLSFDSDLFNYDTRSIWAIFAVGIVYGLPEILSRQDGPAPDSLVYSQGISDLKEAGIKVTEEDYKKYIQNFKGELLVIGEPETREGLWIWYQPAGQLISYFQP